MSETSLKLGGLVHIRNLLTILVDYFFRIIINAKTVRSMNVQSEKLRIIEWVISLNDTDMLERIKSLKEKTGANTDFWEELSEAEKASIERGLKDKEEGNVLSHSEVRSKYEKYL